MDRPEADVPRVFYHPSHFFSCAVGSSNDKIAFVLPALVIHDDQKFATRKGLQGVFHGIELELVYMAIRVR